jgi:hypothetical protein
MQRLQDARTWLDAALRRQAQYIGALFAVAEVEQGGEPAAIGSLVVAAAELLNSAAHAFTAVGPLGTFSDATNPLVTLLRNVHEHWDETRATFVIGEPEKIRSGKELATLTDVSPWRFAWDGTSNEATLGSLSMDWLRSKLDECVT